MSPTTTPASDLHRTKRPFQPSITSYFTRVDSSESSHQQFERETLSPPIPASVQASLLNVGMRVRKSVPEGYKTHKTVAAYKQTDIVGYTGHNKENVSEDQEETGQMNPTPFNSGRAELMPFCGLHKVGGYASQTDGVTGGFGYSTRPTNAYFTSGDLDDDDGSMPFFSSQESNMSTLSTDSMPARRPYEIAGKTSSKQQRKRPAKREYDNFSDEGDDMTTFSAPPSMLTDINGRSIPMPSSSGSRSIARLKTKRKAPAMTAHSQSFDDDFEEADFLKPLEGEIEMGDV